MIPIFENFEDDDMAKGYQLVHGSLHYKLLCCTLFRLNSRYLKQNLRVFLFLFKNTSYLYMHYIT